VANWPAERQAKVQRNYAMEYIRNALPLLVDILGREDALKLGRLCALQIGMHKYDETAAALRIEDDSADSFGALVRKLLEASGDDVRVDGKGLTQTNWRLFREVHVEPVVRAQWLALFEGMLGVHNRFLTLVAKETADGYHMSIQG
jgi:hypothetical protein